jgi:uncharacterized protein
MANRNGLTKRNVSMEDVKDLVAGATIFGVGGGGSPNEGLTSLTDVMNRGKRLVLADLNEFSNHDLLASPYFVGSVAPSKPREGGEPAAAAGDAVAAAVSMLESKLKRKVAGTVATELGGGNTAACLAIAGKLGIPMVDGDLMGRAGPELHQSTMQIFNLSMVPSALVSETGNKILIESCESINDYEAIARYASVVAGGHVAVVDSPLTKSEAEVCVIRGTVSKCVAVGRARRLAAEKGKDPVSAVLGELANGRLLMKGKVKKYAWRDEKGFLFGEATVVGEDDWEGMKFRSWIKNEHIMGWMNDRPAVMPPDLIMFLDASDGTGITNDRLKEGMDVAIVGASISKVWRKPSGLAVFGPRHFGFDYDYVPFENLRL